MADKLMRIQGMTCAHCETTIAEVLTAAGAMDVRADWRAGQARHQEREEGLGIIDVGTGAGALLPPTDGSPRITSSTTDEGPSDSEWAFILQFAEKIRLQAGSIDLETNKQEEGR